jgi:hypothetical protein
MRPTIGAPNMKTTAPAATARMQIGRGCVVPFAKLALSKRGLQFYSQIPGGGFPSPGSRRAAQIQ